MLVVTLKVVTFQTFVSLRVFRVIRHFIIWLAPCEGKINQIARCDWLPARIVNGPILLAQDYPLYPARKKFYESHTLLTKFVRSRWLDIGLVFFFVCLFVCLFVVVVFFLRVYGHRLRLGPLTRKKKKQTNKLGQCPATFTSHLVNYPYIFSPEGLH